MYRPRSSVAMRHLAVGVLLHCASGALAAEAPIRLTEAQLAAAGVAFAPAQAPDRDRGASLALAGRVVVPNSGIEVILAPAAGRVESLLVNPGQPVRAGQALARLHSGEWLAMQRDYVAARARAGLSASRAERDAQLHAEGIISRNRLEQSQTERTEDEARLREQAQLLQLAGMPAATVARLQAAEDMEPLLTLSARRDGIVLEQLAQVGEATEAGMPLLRLGRLAPLWLELQATREQARRINPGDMVAIGNCRSAATVVAVSPQLGEHSQTVTVRAELAQPDGCIAPNQYLEARLTPQATASDIVQIPATSLVRHQGRSYVFVRSAEGILPRQVELERRDEQIAWVSGPIAVGDAVATQGMAALKGAWQGFGVTGDP